MFCHIINHQRVSTAIATIMRVAFARIQGHNKLANCVSGTTECYN